MARTKIHNRKSKGMNSKALLDAFTTAINGLQKQVRSVQRKAPTKEKKISKGPKKLIPKPPGTAGKSTGYNLQEVMGLGKKTRQYNCYLKSIRALSESILEPRKTWRQQPMALRVQVVGMAQEKHPFLQKFAYGWPVADMVKQYLVNAKCYAKRLGDEWEADPGDDDEDKDGEDDEDEDEAGGDEAIEDEGEASEDDEDEDGEDNEDEDEHGEDDEDEDEAGEDEAFEDEGEAGEDDEDEDGEDNEDEDKDEDEGKEDNMNVDTEQPGRKTSVPKKKPATNPSKVPVSKKKLATNPSEVPVSKKKPATNPSKVPVSAKNPQARPTADDDEDNMNVDTEQPGHKTSVPKKKPATNPSKVPVSKKKPATNPSKVPVSKKKLATNPSKVPVPKKKLATNPSKVPVSAKDSRARPTTDDDEDNMNVDTEQPGRKTSVPKKKPATNPSKVPVSAKKSKPPARCSMEKEASIHTYTSNENTNEYLHPRWQRRLEKVSNKNQVNDVETHWDGPPPGPPHEGKGKHVAGNTLVTRCPHEDCTDIILDKPRPRLKNLIHYRRELVAEGAHETKIAEVNFNICQELSNELRMLRVARANGYPEVIDFGALPKRINEMSDVVERLIWAVASGDLKYLERNFIFYRLVYDLVQMNIGTTRKDALVNFSTLRYSAIPEMIREKSRPGYYGPIGYEVIYNVLVHQVEAMSPNSFHPLSAERFLQFVLIPYVACHLVAEDRRINLQAAYEELIYSADVGGALQQLDEEWIEDSNIADKMTEAETIGDVSKFAATE